MINTDQVKIEQLLSRGVENVYPNREFLAKLLSLGKRLTLYTGYDPTAPTLHIGHAITMLKLREFQDLGHKVIMLIGDFTGMIGDPTDKSATRKQLTRQQVLNNCQEYKKQASTILNFKGKNPVEVKYNSKWLAKLNFADVLELTSHFTVQQMLVRDMFQERMKQSRSIHVHEFLYPVMQAYDCVAMDVDGEVGGNDQTFNMLAGRDLMKQLKNKEKFVLTTKLLTDSSGLKMGKTEGNMISLSDSAKDMYGKTMALSDDLIVRSFEIATRIPVERVKEIERLLKSGANPRDLKAELAYEIVKIYYGETEAKVAREEFDKIYTKKDYPMTPVVIKARVKPDNLLGILWELNLSLELGRFPSKTEAKRLIEQGSIKVNDQVVKDWAKKIDVENGQKIDIKIGGKHPGEYSITWLDK
ncbi:MAG: tyrosine--tRNA ligase [Patescibacteria group bacterium]|nr:tyrosine--tRNA ligase [Patescibacteria group bacterium]MDD5121167.1 tyrosine--tRNA ligase [Patescibacteria group bacterium]MDD5221682.1 tyrosine--tRNA ligase [Patescibacteria group bacterium]MDD5395914.1 tyrosine--tRNA ligase [Patescibacteria group bacterium]